MPRVAPLKILGWGASVLGLMRSPVVVQPEVGAQFATGFTGVPADFRVDPPTLGCPPQSTLLISCGIPCFTGPRAAYLDESGSSNQSAPSSGLHRTMLKFRALSRLEQSFPELHGWK